MLKPRVCVWAWEYLLLRKKEEKTVLTVGYHLM